MNWTAMKLKKRKNKTFALQKTLLEVEMASYIQFDRKHFQTTSNKTL